MRRRGRFQVCYSAGFTVSSVLKNTSVSPYPPPHPPHHHFTLTSGMCLPSLHLPLLSSSLSPPLSHARLETHPPQGYSLFLSACHQGQTRTGENTSSGQACLSVCLSVCRQYLGSATLCQTRKHQQEQEVPRGVEV